MSLLLWPTFALLCGALPFSLIVGRLWLSNAEAIGPILVGMEKPIHLLATGANVRDIVNVLTIAAIDA